MSCRNMAAAARQKRQETARKKLRLNFRGLREGTQVQLNTRELAARCRNLIVIALALDRRIRLRTTLQRPEIKIALRVH